MRTDITNPYVGLRPFDVDESLLFFGRSDQTMELLQRLHQHHFVAVVGSSGCGKSSLLRAGLIPSLKAGYLVQDSDHWTIAIMKPGQSPIANLAESILMQVSPYYSGDALLTLIQKIEEEGAGAILDLISAQPKEQSPNHFLLVDQFEELFRFAMEENDAAKRDEAIDFVNIILELADQKRIPFYVVITMRSDFIGDCVQFFGLPEAMNQSQYLVPRINRVQLRTVIEGPAKLFGKNANPALIARLLNELGKVKDELPLLQHALMRMWDFEIGHGKDGELDLNDYESIGGFDKALSNHAEEALIGMTSDELLWTKKIFQALTAVDENGRKIRRAVLLSQLKELTGTSEAKLMAIINRLNEDKRCFLVINKSGDDHDKVIDISHESLIRQWHTLGKWVEEEAESASHYIQLAEAARLHKQKKKDYLSGIELQVAIDLRDKFKPVAAWANRYRSGFKDSMLYLNESEKDWNSKQRQAQTTRQKMRYLIFGVVILLLVTLGAGISTIIFKSLKEEAECLKAEAETQKKAADNRLGLMKATYESLTGFIDSIKDAKTRERLHAIQWSIFTLKKFVGHEDFITSVAFSKDGKTIITGSLDKTARLWDLEEGTIIHEFKHPESVLAVAFSPDNAKVLTGSSNGKAYFWDINGNIIRVLDQHTDAVHSVAFSPDGSKIVTGSGDLSAILWDIDGNVLKEIYGHVGSVRAVTFSPDGRSILTGSEDGTVRLWDLTGEQQGKFDNPSRSAVTSIAYSPDGETFLMGSKEGIARRWDLEGNVLMEFKGHKLEISSVAFSPNGKAIITGSGDDRARVWDLDGNMIQEIRGHNGYVSCVVFSPDGTTLLTGSYDMTARLWDFF